MIRNPNSEGERYTAAEQLHDHKRDDLLRRLSSDPATLTLVGDFLAQLDLAWSWAGRCAERDGTFASAHYLDHTTALRDAAWAAVQAMFRTPEGKELRSLIADKYAAEMRAW